MEPEKFQFKDDGKIPNSKYPVLLYRSAFDLRDDEGAEWLEELFSQNNWVNSWRNGVYSFHHYHSNTHEVLGVYSGSAQLQFGGERGEKIEVKAGDIIIIPAGVSHKKLSGEDLGIVGAYPDGHDWDVKRGLPGERPKADENIAKQVIPATDPLLGNGGGLVKIWA